jgi:WD40 repeat protein
VSVSADGKTIATSSDDKTVRIWSETGRLLQTIRPPVGDGAGHGIAAVALSPDGSTVAYMFSAIHRFDEDNRDRNIFPVQIYHRPTDRVLATIRRLSPGRVGFSPDGKYLAISTESLDLMRTSDWELYATTSFRKDMPEAVTWRAFAFAPSSSSVTAAAGEEIIQLTLNRGDYEKAELVNKKACAKEKEPKYCLIIEELTTASKRFTTAKRTKAPHGKRPASLAWSPDGKRIAVGYVDSGSITLIDPSGGRPVELKPEGLRSAFFNAPESMVSAAWAPDSKSLACAGTMAAEFLKPTVIRTWNLAGKPSFSDIRTSEESRGLAVHRMAAVAGGFVFASDDTIGFVSKDDVRLIQPVSGLRKQLAPNVSIDGKTVSFGFKQPGGSPLGEIWRFDIGSRKLWKETDGEPPKLHYTIDKAPGMEGSGLLSDKPTLNGVLLEVDGRASAYSFSADGESLLLGTAVGLHRFGRTGNPIWSIPVPEQVTGVNISRDGRFVIVALADGTLRWHSQMDGKELLAFYVLNDRRSWVLWTPDGSFDASDGGGALVLIETDKGPEAVRKTELAGLRSPNQRPDVVSAALGASAPLGEAFPLLQKPQQPTPAQPPLSPKDAAMRAQIDCARRSVPQIDDGTSDATTIALALSMRCGAEYNATIETFAAELGNDAQRRMFRQRRMSSEAKLETFLPIVMQYRQAARAK